MALAARARRASTATTAVEGLFAYSSMVQLHGGRIALIYESESHLHLDLIRFRVEDLIGR